MDPEQFSQFLAQNLAHIKPGGREPISDRGRPDYLVPLLTKMGLSQEGAVQLALRLYSRYPEGVRGFHVPKGPHNAKATPELIPNADASVFSDNNGAGYPMPRFVPRPALGSGPPVTRISLPEDPALHQAYLEMISGGSI